MYRVDKVMKAGGALEGGSGSHCNDLYVTARVVTIDLSAASPQWVDIAPMNQPRIHFYLIPLPDGTVMATGGTPTTADGCVTAVLQPEIYDPHVPSAGWVQMAAMAAPRVYHSTALLLPDARVLVAGGEDPVPQTTAQVFSPPYLFGPGGVPAVRPTITRVSANLGPDIIRYGNDFTLVTPDAASIQSISLIAPGAATHSFDQNTRFVELDDFETCGVNALRVAAPPNGNHAPPGYYMLFIVNAAGTPSVARWVQLKDLYAPPCSGLVTVAGEGSRYLRVTPNSYTCPVALRLWGDPLDADVACVSAYVQPTGELGPNPYYKTAAEWGTVHVYDLETIPDAKYFVSAEGCADLVEPNSNSSLTWKWADVNNSGIVTLDDILCELAAFSGNYSQCSFQAADLLPCDRIPGAEAIDIDDVLAVADAFAGEQYPANCPLPCQMFAGGGAESGMSGMEGEGEVIISMVPSSFASSESSSSAQFDIMIEGNAGLRGYQFTFEVSDEDSGAIQSLDFTVDETREDYLYFGRETYVSVDQVGKRILALLPSGETSIEGSRYAGTVSITINSVSSAMESIFVGVVPEGTLFRNGLGEPVPLATTAETVTVDLP